MQQDHRSQDHGNYKAYYRKRQNDTDERISSFRSEWFKSKKCIDIGCNEGAVTLKLAQSLLPHFIVGIDLDPRMIDGATAALKRAKFDAAKAIAAVPSQNANNINLQSMKRSNPFLPRSVALTKPPSPFIQQISSTSSSNSATSTSISALNNSSAVLVPGVFPENTSFVCKNVIDFRNPIAKYDLVMCLSVTKWIHLTEGDSGLLTLFQIIYQLTTVGGRAIIEYQPWSSYWNNRKASETTLRVFNTLKIKPDDFEGLLTNIGFRIEERLGTPLSDAKGFKRPILVLIKDSSSSSSNSSNASNMRIKEIDGNVEMSIDDESDATSNTTSDMPFKGNVDPKNSRKRYFGEVEASETLDLLDEEVEEEEQITVKKSLNIRKKKK
jgi:7SK snRNA methylphosphate capping enzyme